MRNIFFAMSFILVAIASIAMVECASYARLRSEVEVQKENVEIARKGETEYKLNDSTMAVEIRALRLEKEQFDAILKEKDIQIDNLRKENRKKPTAYTETTIHDTMRFIIRDTVFVGADTCVGYSDNYVSFLQCQDTAYFETFDTIHLIISERYKHRFLWWKWGKDGYTQDGWSTNPHTKLHFEDFITVKD